MKNLSLLFLCLLLFVGISCKEEDAAPQVPEAIGRVLKIEMNNEVEKNQEMQIEVTIQKPTPCHKLEEVNVTAAGKVVNYDILLRSSAGICIQTTAESVVPVVFEPAEAGEYVLNFLINGKLFETRTVVVSN